MERWVSPAAVAQAYEELFAEVSGRADRVREAGRAAALGSALRIGRNAR